MNIFKCLETDFELLNKKISRITKKLDKHHLRYTFNKIGGSVELVKIVDSNKKVAVKVIDYTFEMEELKIGNYRVIGVIDHSISGGKENIIYSFVDEDKIPFKYRTINGHCDHCNSARVRNKTILIRNLETGDIKQVGSTCIDEYTGINALDIIRCYQDVDLTCKKEIIVNAEKDIGCRYIKTVEYLSACISLIKNEGYTKVVDGLDIPTKHSAFKLGCDVTYIPLAVEVIEYFKNKEFESIFLNNIKVILSEEYAKTSGIVAYSFLAYEKEKVKPNYNSNFIGSVGEKIEIGLIFQKSIRFSSYYGISSVHLFEDHIGNKFVWCSANDVCVGEGERVIVKGTIKEHKKYKKEKQTVLTRCKIKEENNKKR